MPEIRHYEYLECPRPLFTPTTLFGNYGFDYKGGYYETGRRSYEMGPKEAAQQGESQHKKKEVEVEEKGKEVKQEEGTCNELKVIELKTYLCCDACARKMTKKIKKLDGVDTVTCDMYEGKVTVRASTNSEIVLKQAQKVKKISTLWPMTGSALEAMKEDSAIRPMGGGDMMEGDKLQDAVSSADSLIPNAADNWIAGASQGEMVADHTPSQRTDPKTGGRKRSGGHFDVLDLLPGITSSIKVHVEEVLNMTLLPLVSALRSREENEQKHREKLLALEESKLALEREKTLKKRLRGPSSN